MTSEDNRISEYARGIAAGLVGESDQRVDEVLRNVRAGLIGQRDPLVSLQAAEKAADDFIAIVRTHLGLLGRTTGRH